MQSNFIEITLRHGCSPVILLHISRTPFLKNTSGRLLCHSAYLSLFLAFVNVALFFSVFYKNLTNRNTKDIS